MDDELGVSKEDVAFVGNPHAAQRLAPRALNMENDGMEAS